MMCAVSGLVQVSAPLPEQHRHPHSQVKPTYQSYELMMVMVVVMMVTVVVMMVTVVVIMEIMVVIDSYTLKQ